jgi:hypothetical protein
VYQSIIRWYQYLTKTPATSLERLLPLPLPVPLPLPLVLAPAPPLPPPPLPDRSSFLSSLAASVPWRGVLALLLLPLDVLDLDVSGRRLLVDEDVLSLSPCAPDILE